MDKIVIENASFFYNDPNYVWENVSFSVAEGDSFCLLGANGCGKTTLFNCINGNFKLRSGQILINGKSIQSYSVPELARTVGIVYQEHTAPFPYTALEVVRMGRAPHLGLFRTPSKQDTAMALEVMEELDIAHLADKRYTHISGGERQLVLIARTLCQQPEMILFDEPTSHLDFKNQARIINTIKRLSQKGMTILMTSHFPNHVFKMGNKVALMGEKSIIASGDVNDIMTEENLERTYGIKINIVHAPIGGIDTVFCEADTNITESNEAAVKAVNEKLHDNDGENIADNCENRTDDCEDICGAEKNSDSRSLEDKNGKKAVQNEPCAPTKATKIDDLSAWRIDD